MAMQVNRSHNAVVKSPIVIVPLDHGVHDGPIQGLNNFAETLQSLTAARPDGVVVHKGMMDLCKVVLEDIPIWLHLSASSHLGKFPLKKVLVASADEAAEIGAAGVSVHVNMGNEFEPEMLKDLGAVATQCRRLNLPLLAMMYVRRQRFGSVQNITRMKEVSHAARVACELGASVVKVPYTGSISTFRSVVSGCHVPVVIAGGKHHSNNAPAVLEMVRSAALAGAAGVSMGRNIFQAPNPAEMIREIRSALSNVGHEPTMVG